MSTVADIFDAIAHRMPDKLNRYPALNNVIRLIWKRLIWHESDLVVGALSETVSASSEYATMPTDFWGLKQKPYINGNTCPLHPLPSPDDALYYTSDGEPLYYSLKGSSGIYRLYLYPNNSSEITINGDYWARPSALSKITDTIPFNELFDEVIQDALIIAHANGALAAKDIISMGVDDIVPRLELDGEIPFPDDDNINDYI